ncbi:MAG: wax ester/triacylglycerol synthase domain-containing protein [Acidimicrobiales bacterium]
MTVVDQGRMDASDSILWTLDRDPLLRSPITAVVVFDREPPFEEVVRRFGVLCRREHHFRSTVVAPSVPWDLPRWREDDRFEVTDHLRHMRVALPGTLRDVLDLAQSSAISAFDGVRPLWEASAVGGMAAGQAALVIRVHHAVIDGVGGLQVAAHLLDRDREGTPLLSGPEPDAAPRDAGRRSPWETARAAAGSLIGAPERAGHAARHIAGDPVGSVRRGWETLNDAGALVAPSPRPLSPLLVGRSLVRRFETIDPEPDSLTRAAAGAGVTLNDVFVASLLRGLSHYHHQHGSRADHLRVVMPVSTRLPSDPLDTNRFVPVRLVLPADLPDASAYLRTVPGLLARWKHSPALGVSDALTAALGHLPAPATVGTFALMLKGVDFMATDIPGPPTTAYFAGAKVTGVYAFAPTSGAAFNAALLTLAGRPSIGLNIDAGAVPDPDVLVECLGRGFEDVAAAAAG